MGIFDSVYVDCPHCGEPVEFQSKASEDAYCRRFTLDDAPVEILADIINCPEHCMTCNGWMALIEPSPNPRPVLQTVKVRAPENPLTHQQGMKWWPDGKPFTADDIEATTPVAHGNHGLQGEVVKPPSPSETK